MKGPWVAASLLLALLPFVLAQNSTVDALTKLPPCAISCLLKAIPDSPCSLTNETCICADVGLKSAVTACVTTSCTIKEALLAKNTTTTACKAPIRDRHQTFAAVSTTLAPISGSLVALRFCFKLFVTKNLHLDDWFILVTFVVGLPGSVNNVHGVGANGLGRDVWTLPYDTITNFAIFFLVASILYFAEVTLLKLSMLFFYLRIFPSPGVRRLLWATVVVNCLYGFLFVMLALFQCKPISYFWTKWDNEHAGTCLNINAIAWANAGISIVFDLWMLAIPMVQIRSLNLQWKKKVGVGLMFAVGTFVTIVSIIRLHSLVSFANSNNPTWDNYDVSLWSTIEINVGIICACMPALRLVLVRFFPKLVDKSQHYQGRSSATRSRAMTNPEDRGAAADGRAMPPRQGPRKGIVYTQSYSVEYAQKEDDEVSLVIMPGSSNREPQGRRV